MAAQEIMDQLTLAKAPFQASVEAIDKVPALVDAEVEKARLAGIEEGKGMWEQPNLDPDKAAFTEEQLKNAVNSAVQVKESEMQIIINEKVAEIEALKSGQVELEAKVEAAETDKALAVDAKRAEIMADWKSAKVDDDAFAAKHGG